MIGSPATSRWLFSALASLSALALLRRDAAAQEPGRWIPAASTSISSIFLDRITLRRLEGGVVEVWFEERFERIQEDSTPFDLYGVLRRDGSGMRKFYYTRVRKLENFDCIGRRFVLRQLLFYGPDGRVVEQVEMPDPKYQVVVPDTISELLHTAVCRLAGEG